MDTTERGYGGESRGEDRVTLRITVMCNNYLQDTFLAHFECNLFHCLELKLTLNSTAIRVFFNFLINFLLQKLSQKY